ncbi:MAG TPA: FAD-binding oxidoreductase [Steroidobacteraceae bacterium]|jgi:4-cresol dehydrogenase (hydroxylating)|nr:FAD-binding oxidoreductase [Steroidobacteraceae bacterium]
MGLPPGVSAGDFADAIRQFEAVVGSDWVFTRDEDVALYRDAYSPLWGEPQERLASAAIAPDAVEQVQQIVRIANTFKIPLYTISTGRNLAYGGSAPAYSGSVVLDLKRMNRILEVSERNAYALVEPGVSYFDLFRHIRERQLKLWIDCPDPGWGSPVGNALDHGAGYTPLPFRDHFDAHCGMEVVLANGEIVRTGMGALPGAQTWQQFKYGIGPTLDGLFSQSNFGIVTKMGFWLYPQPEAFRSGTVKVPRHDDIIALVDILASLTYAGIVNCQFGIISPVFNAAGPPDARFDALLGKPQGASAQEWDQYAQDKGRNFWQIELRFYGPEKVIAAQWEHVQERFSAIRGASFEDGVSYRFPLTDEQISAVGDRAPLGIPSLGIFSSLLAATGEAMPITGHMDLSPVLPMTGEAILQAHELFTRAFREWGVTPWYGFAQSYHWRAVILFYGFPVTHDIEANKKIRVIYERMIKLAADHGWGVYRTHVAFMDTAVGTYSYNDHALLRLQQTLKDAIDPNGILSAGRYGIWPKHLRGAKS